MDNEVTRSIPHRPPFLFIDDVVSATPTGLIASLHVRPDFEFFKGHYPGNPIMPGVLISEAVFQAGALFLVKSMSGAEGGVTPGAVPVLTRISDARFRSIVRPGDNLTIEVKMRERMGRFFFLSGSVRAGERRVMTVDFGVAMSEPEGATPAS